MVEEKKAPRRAEWGSLEGMPAAGTKEYNREYMRRKRGSVPRKAAEVAVKEAKLATAIACGVPQGVALEIAGYDKGSRKLAGTPSVKEGVAEIRARLQRTKGFTLEDSLEFYRRVAEDEGEKMAVRLAARKELDAKLGYNVAQKVEVSERKSLSMAIGYFDRLGVNPAELLRDGSGEEVSGED